MKPYSLSRVPPGGVLERWFESANKMPQYPYEIRYFGTYMHQNTIYSLPVKLKKNLSNQLYDMDVLYITKEPHIDGRDFFMLAKGNHPSTLLYGNIVFYNDMEMLLCSDDYTEYNINRMSLPHTPPSSESIIRSEELEIFGVSYQRVEVPLNPSSYYMPEYSKENHVIFKCPIPSHNLTINICCDVTADMPITPKVCLIDQEGIGSYHIYASPGSDPVTNCEGVSSAKICLIQHNIETGGSMCETIFHVYIIMLYIRILQVQQNIYHMMLNIYVCPVHSHLLK